MKQKNVTLIPMTAEMYHQYFMEYDNDPDLYLDQSKYIHYEYSAEKVDQYIRRQIDKKRIPLAIVAGSEIVGELIIKDIVPHESAVIGIAMKNAAYKDRGFGTAAEKIAVKYIFDTLNIPIVFADTIRTNVRSQHVLEKVGFVFTHEDENFKYYRIDR